MKSCLLLLCVIAVSIANPVLANNPILYEYYEWQENLMNDIDSEIDTTLEEGLRLASVTVLMDAARDGTSSDIRKLLNDGEYIHAKDYDGDTALIYAVMYNTPEVVQTLIDAGAYVNRMILLELAGYRIKHTEVIDVLVKSGAEVNARDDEGNTVLMKAVGYFSRSSGVLNALIEAGAEVNAKNDDGMTPLMFAAESGNDNTVNVLLDAGADIKAEDNNGRTALYYAKRSRSITNDTLKRLGASWYDLHWF